MKVTIIGSGGWGTALAIQASKSHETVLWSFIEEEARRLGEQRENSDYLPGVKIPDLIKITSNAADAVKESELIIFVSPSKFFESVAEGFKNLIPKEAVLVSATKGFAYPEEKRMSEILEEIFENHPIVVLSGPSHAEEVAQDVPTSVVVASKNIDAAKKVQKALSNERFRLYIHEDVIGVEVSAALKNVIAIAAGMLRGFGYGDNTMAALITRGLAEIRRLGIRLGAKEATFAGLAGVGDLIVTCVSKHSRNGRLGEALAKGMNYDEYTKQHKMVTEGAEAVKSAVRMAEEYHMELPISRAVYDVLYQGADAKDALLSLMRRPLKHEWE